MHNKDPTIPQSDYAQHRHLLIQKGTDTDMTTLAYSIHTPNFHTDTARSDYYAYYALSLLKSALYNVQDYSFGITDNGDDPYGYDTGNTWLKYKLDYLQIKQADTPYTGSIDAKHKALYRMVYTYMEELFNYHTMVNLDKHRDTYRSVKVRYTAIADAFKDYCESNNVHEISEHVSEYLNYHIYLCEHDNGKLYEILASDYMYATSLTKTYDAQIDVNIINTHYELYASSCSNPYNYKLFADHIHAAMYDAMAHALRASGELMQKDMAYLHDCNKAFHPIELDRQYCYDNESANRWQDVIFSRVKLALHGLFYALHHDPSMYAVFLQYMNKAMDNLYVAQRNYHSMMVEKMADMYVDLIDKRTTMQQSYDAMTQAALNDFQYAETLKQAYNYQLPHGLGDMPAYMATLQAHTRTQHIDMYQHTVSVYTDKIQQHHDDLRDYAIVLARYDYHIKMNKIMCDSMQALTNAQLGSK